MRYTEYSIVVDPTNLETRIYLRKDDGAMDDYLALDPEAADTLSGSLIMSNAQRKRMMISSKGDGIAARFRRRKGRLSQLYNRNCAEKQGGFRRFLP